MSRELPRRPNLEHLKKQAKDRLADLRRHEPESKLADALHAVARDYGFATWPALKAHVASFPVEGPALSEGRVEGPAGTWKANLSKSKRHPANLFQSATLAFELDGDAITITHVGVDASGQEVRSAHTLHADGKEHASSGGYSLLARWHDPHLLETVGMKDGQIVGRGTYAVSADGRTLTISSTDASANAEGWQSDVDQVIVLDRQEVG